MINPDATLFSPALPYSSGRLPPNRPCSSFFFQAEDGIRDLTVTGVQTCALPIFGPPLLMPAAAAALAALLLVRPWTALLLLSAYFVVLVLSSVRPAWRLRNARLIGADRKSVV